jgi:RNA polymerase sigma-70 factor, ECF subfamily
VGSHQVDNANSPPASQPSPQVDEDVRAAHTAFEGNNVPVNATQPVVESAAETNLSLEALIDQHHTPLFRYAFRLCGQAADAEDLVQQTFLVAFRKLEQVRTPEHVTAWLYAVLRNCFLKSRRKPIPQPVGGADLDLDTFAGPSPEVRDFDSEELQLALDQLPPEFKIVLVMFYFEQCAYKEIAHRLELPIGTVMSRLARAKQRLRWVLAGGDSPNNQDHAGETTALTKPTNSPVAPAEPGR